MLIDLDDRPAAAEAPRRLLGRLRGWALPAVASVLLLGGAAPPPAGAVEVAALDGRTTTTVVLIGDGVFTARPGGDIQAVPLRPGGPEWTVASGIREPYLQSRDPWVVLDGTADGTFVLLDSRTGAERWRSTAGRYTRMLGNTVAIATEDGLRVIDPADGRTIWSRPEFTGPFDVADDRLIALADGRLTVLAGADGRTLAGPRRIAGADEPPQARVVGDRLLLFGAGHVTAYRLDDLTRSWQRPLNEIFDVTACGPWLCLGQFTGLTVIDPESGAERWTDPRWRFVHGDGVVVGVDSTVARIDLATGRVLQEFGLGGVVDDLVLHTEKDRTLAIRFTDGRVLGTLPQLVPAGCARDGVHLACPGLDGTVRVWRLAK